MANADVNLAGNIALGYVANPSASVNLAGNIALGYVANPSASVNLAGNIVMVVLGSPPPPPPPPPPQAPINTLEKTIPSYLYVQYNDDEYLQAFVQAYNQLAQDFLDWMTSINLPIYTGLTGPMLDWVGNGLYGIPRPVFSSGVNYYVGPLNTGLLNYLMCNGVRLIPAGSYTTATDDIYRRVITWNFYKGDGNHMNVFWLKRRIVRWIRGNAGAPVDQTFHVSIYNTSSTAMQINLINTSSFNPEVLTYLVAGIAQGVLQMPFQFTYTVTVVS